MKNSRAVRLWLLGGLVAWTVSGCATSATDLRAFMASANGTQLRALTQYFADRRVGTEPLSTLSRHSDPGVRSSAIIALAQNEDPKAAPAIQQAMSDGHVAVREHAAFAAGQLGGPWAMDALLSRLKVEKTAAVRRALWRAIGRVGDTRALDVLRQASGVDRQPGLEALAHVLRREQRPAWHEKAVVTALDDSNASIRTAGLYAIHRSFQDPPEWIRKRAAESLGNEDPGERDAAVRVLRKGMAGVEVHGIQGWKSKVLTGHQRAALAQGLGRTPGDMATTTLVQFAHAEVRRLVQSKTFLHTAYHPLITALQALMGRPLAMRERQVLTAIRRAVSEQIPTPSIATGRRAKRVQCACNLLQGVTKECTALEMVNAMGRAGKRADLEGIRSYAQHRLPAVRMAHLHALGAATDDMHSDIVVALDDEDLPVVATAADWARQKTMAGPRIRAGLDRAWKRARDDGNEEVLLDLLRAMDELDVDGLSNALEWSISSGNLSLSRTAVDLIEKRSGDRPIVPVDSIQQFNVEDVAPYRRGAGFNTARVVTDIGAFTLRLRTDWAPRTVSRFIALARTGFFDGLSFHRVVPYFVIQGGDPRGDGWGGPPTTIRCENNPLPYSRGTVGMALAGKDTGGSQWFVTHAHQPHLFGRYTVFGKIVSGQDVVDRIVVGDSIRRIELSRRDWSR